MDYCRALWFNHYLMNLVRHDSFNNGLFIEELSYTMYKYCRLRKHLSIPAMAPLVGLTISPTLAAILVPRR
jgi:hypothetical protein